MSQEHHAELHEHFPSVWTAIVQEWTNTTESSDKGYPPLNTKQRSMLKQIQPVALVNTVAVLTAPTRWVKEEVERGLAPHIREVLNQKLGMHVILAISEKEMDPSSHQSLPERHEEQAAQPDPEPTLQAENLEDIDEFQRDDDSALLDMLSADQENWASEENNEQSSSKDQWNAVPPHTPTASDPTPAPTPMFGQDGAQITPKNPHHPQLNPNYTFERFVIGSSNQFAAAACRSVSEQPAKGFNPLFLWGESGLGKTHLLHAIAHYSLELRPNMRVMYVSTEELTNDFINAIANDTREDFKRRYRQVDMLIVDDIQFLERKESTQEEFFHTFNALHQAGKQIVLSSDRPPIRLATLEDRLRTRFEGGLITDVTSPDLETRMAILTNKAKRENMNLPEDVKMMIAERYDRSIRALEGALTRVIAYCSLENQEMSVTSAKIALQDILPDEVEVNPQVVIEVVAEYFGLSIDELTGKGRSKHLVTARQIAMYLCRELTELSLPKLGAAFGGRDHTTVMYAERRVREGLTEDKKTFDQVQELLTKVKSRARA